MQSVFQLASDVRISPKQVSEIVQSNIGTKSVEQKVSLSERQFETLISLLSKSKKLNDGSLESNDVESKK